MEKQSAVPLASVTLADGKERTLVYTFAALKALRKEHNVSVTKEGTAKLFQGIDEVKLASLLMIGLKHDGPGGWPEATEADLDVLLTGQNQLAALNAIDAALGFSLIKNALELIDLLPGPRLPFMIATLKKERQQKDAAAAAAAPDLGVLETLTPKVI